MVACTSSYKSVGGDGGGGEAGNGGHYGSHQDDQTGERCGGDKVLQSSCYTHHTALRRMRIAADSLLTGERTAAGAV